MGLPRDANGRADGMTSTDYNKNEDDDVVELPAITQYHRARAASRKDSAELRAKELHLLRHVDLTRVFISGIRHHEHQSRAPMEAIDLTRTDFLH